MNAMISRSSLKLIAPIIGPRNVHCVKACVKMSASSGRCKLGNPMKRWLSVTVSILALAAMPLTASARQDFVHYGPISSGSPDSGTCGNNWASDTYMRAFDAATSPNANGTFNVTETFVGGRFTNVAGPSPDACDPTGVKGSTIADGVTGSFSGNFLIVVSNGTFDPNTNCDS